VTDALGPDVVDVEARVPPRAAPGLTRALLLLDATAVALAWSIVLLLSAPDVDGPGVATIVAAVVVVTVAFASIQRLYQARACALRAEEKARLVRVVLVDAVAVVAIGGLAHVDLPISTVVWGSLSAFALLATFRAGFRHWLTLNRARGRYLRPIVVVGDNDESAALVSLLREQPELGYEVLGYLGGRPSEAPGGGPGARWLGPAGTAVETSRLLGATGLLIVVTAHGSHEIDHMTRSACAAGLHVHLSTGLQGIDHSRLRLLPISHEPMLYVEAVRPSPVAMTAKRVLDVALATVGLLLALPLLAVAAIGIKLTDRGPVFFRQQRIGRDGEPFDFFKLRTMTPGSDARLDEVSARNTRRDSPLFKDPRDPRRTRVGRVLEATSIDELPQLWNVLRGDMSLVGPRPALPHEVAEFDDELLRRHSVRPGITGLWQVEGRDNPSFRPYRRLDLVYVENFSLTLDLVILSLTVQLVIARAAAKALGWDGDGGDGGDGRDGGAERSVTMVDASAAPRLVTTAEPGDRSHDAAVR
jgi:exopolysaccharide biosynthesis polyprenyl glycosylphosphotransferase